jgi:hypothetical protein
MLAESDDEEAFASYEAYEWTKRLDVKFGVDSLLAGVRGDLRAHGESHDLRGGR